MYIYYVEVSRDNRHGFGKEEHKLAVSYEIV